MSAGSVIHVERQENGLAIGALASGLVGTALGFVPVLFSTAWGLGLAAFTLGLVARGRAGRLPQAGRRTMATCGLALGIAAFALGCAGYAIASP
jgi:hypothetical protein